MDMISHVTVQIMVNLVTTATLGLSSVSQDEAFPSIKTLVEQHMSEYTVDEQTQTAQRIFSQWNKLPKDQNIRRRGLDAIGYYFRLCEIAVRGVDKHRDLIPEYPVLEPLRLPLSFYHSAYRVAERAAIQKLEKASLYQRLDNQTRQAVVSQCAYIEAACRDIFSVKCQNEGAIQITEYLLGKWKSSLENKEVADDPFSGYRRTLSHKEIVDLVEEVKRLIWELPTFRLERIPDPSAIPLVVGPRAFSEKAKEFEITSPERAMALIYNTVEPLYRVQNLLAEDSFDSERNKVLEDAKAWMREAEEREAWRIREARIPMLNRWSDENRERV